MKPNIVFILKIRELRQLDSKSQSQIPTPVSLNRELLAEWALYWHGLVLSSFVELIYELFRYQKLKLFVFQFNSFIRKHFAGCYTLRNKLFFISHFRKHLASSGQKTHRTELHGRLSPKAVFTVRKQFCTSAVQLLYMFTAIQTLREHETAEDEASYPPGSDMKQWVSGHSHICMAHSPTHLHIYSHLPCGDSQPLTTPRSLIYSTRWGQGRIGGGRENDVKDDCGVGGPPVGNKLYSEMSMSCHVEITKSSFYKCLTWRLKSSCCLNPSHSSVGKASPGLPLYSTNGIDKTPVSTWAP